MPIAVACACGQEFQVRNGLAGQTTACPGCGGEVAVPGPAAAIAPAQPAPPPAAPPSFERQVLARLDHLGGLAVAINTKLGWAVVLLILLLISSCGRTVLVPR